MTGLTVFARHQSVAIAFFGTRLPCNTRSAVVSASNPNLPEKLWSKMFWAVVLLLVLLLVPAFSVKLLLRKPLGEMVLPYLAYAVPCLTVLFVALLLRTWEGRGASPRALALAWSLCVTLFMFVSLAATFYSGVELHLFDRSNSGVVFAFATCAGGACVVGFTSYSNALKVTSARASGTSSKT